MTSKLSGSYNDLRNEIEERKRAEEEIKRYNAVLSGINSIFKAALTSETEEERSRVLGCWWQAGSFYRELNLPPGLDISQ
jgi:hypothetical protein